MNRQCLVGIGAITITSILWGTTGTAATFAPDAGPIAIGAAALGIGGLLQALIAVPALRAARAALRERIGTIMLGAFAVAVYPLAFYSSMHLAGVAIGTVVSLASAPLASGLLERVIEHRPLSGGWILAAGLGTAGSAALCLSQTTPSSGETVAVLAGIGLGVIAGITYATYSWTVRRLMTEGIGRAAAMGSVFGTGGLLLIPVLLATGAPPGDARHYLRGRLHGAGAHVPRLPPLRNRARPRPGEHRHDHHSQRTRHRHPPRRHHRRRAHHPDRLGRPGTPR